MKSNNVTLKDIAKEVGISPAAVSRSLKDSPDISEETKQRVREVAKKMGYSVNHYANALRTGKTYTLSILVPDNANPYNALLIKSIEEAAKKKNYIVIVINTNESSEDELQAINTAIGLHVEAILAVPVNPDNYQNITIPCVLMARDFKDKEISDFSYVVNNDKKIMEMAVSHLLERFDRPVYFIGGARDFLPMQIRRDAFKETLEGMGKTYSEDLVLYGENTSPSGYCAAETLLKKVNPPFSVVCLGGSVAAGVLKALRDRGIDVPGQVSLVSCDDIEMTEYLEVPITSVRHARSLVGAKAADFIFSCLEEKNHYREQLKVVLQPELIVRKST